MVTVETLQNGNISLIMSRENAENLVWCVHTYLDEYRGDDDIRFCNALVEAMGLEYEKLLTKEERKREWEEEKRRREEEEARIEEERRAAQEAWRLRWEEKERGMKRLL